MDGANLAAKKHINEQKNEQTNKQTNKKTNTRTKHTILGIELNILSPSR